MQLPSWKAVNDILCRWMDITNNGTSYLAVTAKIKGSCYWFNHYTAVCVAHCPFLYFVCCTYTTSWDLVLLASLRDYLLLWNVYIFIPSQCCIVGCNTLPPFRWKPVFWRSMYLHCSCWSEVRVRLGIGTFQGIWSLGTQEWMSYRPVPLLKSTAFPSQERHGTVRNYPFGNHCVREVWSEKKAPFEVAVSAVSFLEDVTLVLGDNLRFPYGANKRVFPTAFRCYLLRFWLMFWTYSIVLGLFIQLRFRDWLCPSREVAGGVLC